MGERFERFGRNTERFAWNDSNGERNGLHGTIGTENGTLNGLHGTVLWCSSTPQGL
jgi:hypothetical protein